MYRTKILGVASGLTAIVLAAAVLIVWSLRTIEHHRSQAMLAQDLLVAHLELSGLSYRLFKQLTDGLLLGQQADQSVVRNKRGAVADILARIRSLELRQRDALGEAAPPGSVEDTDDLEASIDGILAAFDRSLGAAGPADGLVEEVLEQRIDGAFRDAIQTAVDRQRRVVNEMNLAAERVHARLLGLSIALVCVALLAAATGAWLLLRGIARPLQALQEAVAMLGQGQLAHRAPVGFDREFDAMALAFNSMADRLSERQQSERAAQQALEAAVAERTAALTRANAELERADAARRHFFADVSHELRTPLTVIRGEAQIALRRTPQDAEIYRDALQCIQDQAAGLGRLVEDMLFVARADAQSVRLQRRDVATGELLQGVLRDMERPAEQRDVRLWLSLPERPPVIEADPQRLRQLLVILLDNALQHTRRNGRVHLALCLEGNETVITVADDGIGIAEQDLPFVFDRFFRGGRRSGGEDTGTGLGLAVARAIVAAHGGRITAESRPGEGTRMTVRLPEDCLCRS